MFTKVTGIYPSLIAFTAAHVTTECLKAGKTEYTPLVQLSPMTLEIDRHELPNRVCHDALSPLLDLLPDRWFSQCNSRAINPNCCAVPSLYLNAVLFRDVGCSQRTIHVRHGRCEGL
jgi:hypothetical protein